MTDVTSPAVPATSAASPAAVRPERKRYDRSIIEGPLAPAVWRLAWPTMLTNIIGGLQGMVDQALVGNLIGYKANAAIGVSSQIFLIVIIFMSSVFTGMSVLVARFTGAGDHDKVDRVVYQAFITAIGLSLFVMAPIGYFASPALLELTPPDAELVDVGKAPGRAPMTQEQINALIQQAVDHFAKADAALKAGDLATYQAEINAAQTAISRANELAAGQSGGGTSPSPSPSPSASASPSP